MARERGRAANARPPSSRAARSRAGRGAAGTCGSRAGRRARPRRRRARASGPRRPRRTLRRGSGTRGRPFTRHRDLLSCKPSARSPTRSRSTRPARARSDDSPVRNAFGGQVIGSTARLRLATSGSGSPVNTMQVGIALVHPERERRAAVRVVQHDARATVGAALEVGVGVVEHGSRRSASPSRSRTRCPRRARSRTGRPRSSESSDVRPGTRRLAVSRPSASRA